MAWDHPNCVHLPPLHAWPRGVQPARFQFEQPCAMVFPCQEGQETIVFACFHWSNLSLGSCNHAKDQQDSNSTPVYPKWVSPYGEFMKILPMTNLYQLLKRSIQHMFLMPFQPSETHSSQASLAFGSDPPSNSCRTSRGDPSDAATCNSVQPKASVLSLALTEISESFCWSPWQSVRSRTENPMVNAANVRMRMSGMFGSEGLFCRLLVGLDVEKTGASELSSCKSHADEGSSSIGTRFVCSETRVEAVLSRAMSAALTCSRDMKVTMKAIIDLDLRLQRQKNQRRMSREDWEVAVPQLDRQLAEFM